MPGENIPLEPHTTQLLVLLLAPGVVPHIPQVVPALLLITVPLEKPLLVLEAEHHGEHDQELFNDLLVNALRERPDRGPVLPDHVRVGAAGVCGDELGDVVDLKVVLDARYEVAGPRGLPAVVIALLEGGAVGRLGRVWEGQDRVREGELGVDLTWSQAVIGNVEEACFFG